jgi:UDP-N-acetylmuramate dehydrogenase
VIGIEELAAKLGSLTEVQVRVNAPMTEYTRFGLGGPAELLVDAKSQDSFIDAHQTIVENGLPVTVIGGGTNLVVADQGVTGAVLRFCGNAIRLEDNTIHAEAGAILQDVVDASIQASLAGLHTMTRIPGWLGAAVYGNAGAYGNSIHQFVRSVSYARNGEVESFSQAECEFAYRESIFKRKKDCVILAAQLELPSGDQLQLQSQATKIQQIRDAKYPPDMKCAGSIFKNFLFEKLPYEVQRKIPDSKVTGGKVPSAYFLEVAGAKGMRAGQIVVADYHANLLYNLGTGTTEQLKDLIRQLKHRVYDRFGLHLEEEVQYLS